MLKATLRVILPLYSFLGVVSIKNDINGFQTSGFQAVRNVLMMPLVFVFTIFTIKSPQLRSDLFRDDYLRHKILTAFQGFIAITTAEVVQWSSFYICILQFLRRERITKFLNRLTEVELDEKYAEKLKRRWSLHFILMASLFSMNCVIQFVTRGKATLLSIGGLLILMYSLIFFCCALFSELNENGRNIFARVFKRF